MHQINGLSNSGVVKLKYQCNRPKTKTDYDVTRCDQKSNHKKKSHTSSAFSQGYSNVLFLTSFDSNKNLFSESYEFRNITDYWLFFWSGPDKTREVNYKCEYRYYYDIIFIIWDISGWVIQMNFLDHLHPLKYLP